MMNIGYLRNNLGLPFEQKIIDHFSPELQITPAFNVSFVLCGTLDIHYNNRTRHLNEHDFYFFPPFESHFVVTAEEGAHVLSLLIDYTFIKQYCPDAVRLSLKRRHVSQNDNDPVYCRLREELASIVFQSMKNDTCNRLKQLSTIADIISVIFENFGLLQSGSVDNASYTQDRVIEILNYINDNYMHKISVDHMAGHLGIHPQYFSAFFKKHFHVNFVDYLATFRINRSITRLTNTEDSILDIAIDHGFNNHKTYSTAFRKQYDMSPTQFRKIHQQPEDAPSAALTMDKTEKNNVLSYLWSYLGSSTNNSLQGTAKVVQNLHLDIPKLSKSPRRNTQKKFLAAGCAYSCLRSEVQAQIKEAKRDLGFDYLKLRDIFSDNLFVYYERENMPPLINWQSLDTIFDFLLSLDIKPFPEIGFMPRDLASKKQYAGWQFHPNVSFPKSLDRWIHFIEDFLRHLIDRYGLQEIRSWYFDFWTAPDLDIKNGYWYESQEKFFLFYKSTYEAFAKVDPELRLGTPNFSTITGYAWYEAFFQFCYANHIFPAYVSIHLYDCTISDQIKVFLTPGMDAFLPSYERISTKAQEDLKKLHQIMNRNGFRTLDVIVTEWNLNFLPKDFILDTCYMAPYIIQSLIRTLDSAYGIAYSALSDISREFFAESILFQGSPGLIEYHGLKKAAYNAMQLFNTLGDTILSTGENYIFTQKGSQYQLLIYNLPEFDGMYAQGDPSGMDYRSRYNIYEKTDDITVKLVVTLPGGAYYVKKQEVNRQYGSAFDLWAGIDYPERLNQEITAYLVENSKPRISYQSYSSNGTLMVEELIPALGVLLLEFINARDLNA
ncbi:MAG TPA: helix-turn-helix domain-containing protein [Clostridiales bacterium]|nr:helix-turn-helix domain-containing protein [Clostridiales bacterium]